VKKIVLGGGNSVSRACLQLEWDERRLGRARIVVVEGDDDEVVGVEAVIRMVSIHTSALLNIQRDLSTYGGKNDSELTSDTFNDITCPAGFRYV
jgi:hypothetical protein